MGEVNSLALPKKIKNYRRENLCPRRERPTTPIKKSRDGKTKHSLC